MNFLSDNLLYSIPAASSPSSTLGWFFSHGGFLIISIVVIWGFIQIWLDNRQSKFYESIKWIYLAIDVPQNSEQSPKAVEQIFTQIWGSISSPNFIEKWWEGKFMTNFSFELVSIGGYIQYVVRAPNYFRDLVEAAIYAQYPDAQITEIEDYSEKFTPDNFREKGYQLWGTQFIMNNDEAYPIKTYPLFEHSISQKIVDPMAAILEIFSRFGSGEEGWLQIVALPVGDSWKKKSAQIVGKLLGREVKDDPGAAGKVLDSSYQVAKKAGDILWRVESEKGEEKKDEPWKMLALSPQERSIVEGIERKSDKIGYKVKIRYIYFGNQGNFSKARGVSGVTGALNQFSLLNSNGFRPCGLVTTKREYYRVEKRTYQRQRAILRSYKSRSQTDGCTEDGYILNTEELASIYHFPYKDVIAPTLRTAAAKRAEAPIFLPTDTIPEERVEQTKQPVAEEKKLLVPPTENQGGPPTNLPV